jgi:phospholipid/cholesterol/gamma-HCH transport system substrate-binding protein
MRDELIRNLRVGALTVVAVAVLAVTIFTIGNRRQLFTRHTKYVTTFHNVTGLQVGAPVRLSGVDVGFVEAIELPEKPDDQRITVRFSLDDAYTERIREDTRVSIRTIGLLGDKYLEIRGGSADAPRLLEGGVVTGVDRPEVEEFVASGEDLMENLIAISSSLRVVLDRVEAGEGLLGALTTEPESGERLGDALMTTITELRAILERVEAGEGLLGRMLREDGRSAHLIADVDEAVRSVRDLTTTVARDLEREDTTYAALMRDPTAGTTMIEAITAFRDASEALAAAVDEIATGKGTLPRLMADEEYADSFLDDLGELLANMRSISEKLDEGTGTAGAFINDPQMYQDLENVVRGVKESSIVSWFIRNRRERGEEVAAEERQMENVGGR